jgi:tricarboxylate carrier
LIFFFLADIENTLSMSDTSGNGGDGGGGGGAPPQVSRIDLSRPRYDQRTYIGRARHFFAVCDPRTVLSSRVELEKARAIVRAHRAGHDDPSLTEDDLWHAKRVYDSAFHADTGELLFLPGRMSFQMPGNMVITGCMLTFLSTTPQIVFWQVVNQSFNACVNYTNRNASSEVSMARLGTAYVAAVSAAVTTALGLGRLFDRVPAFRTPFAKRFVPLIAVAAANAMNIPLMRSVELQEGIEVRDGEGEGSRVLGKSTAAARTAIPLVVLSRVIMAFPSVVVPNIIMSRLEGGPFLRKYPRVAAPLMVGLVGANLLVSTPLACALFPQTTSISVDSAESEFRGLTHADGSPVERIYFNKGL